MVDESPSGSEPGVVFEWDGEQPLTEDTPRPKAARKGIPEWYEELPAQDDFFRTVKLCASFGDAMTTGFLIPLTFDFEFKKQNGEIQTSVSDAPGEREPVKKYGATSPEQPKNNSTFKPPEFRFEIPWKIHTPDGYSTLITHPLNRLDQGVRTYSLLAPTDDYDGPTTVPASTTRPFGSVDKGDSFLHVIPIRRDTLISEMEVTDEYDPIGSQIYEGYQETTHFVAQSAGYYRRECWRPKANENVTDKNQSGKNTSDRISELVGNPVENPFADDPPSPQDSMRYVIPERDMGVVPEPSPASSEIPEWITDPETFSYRGDIEQRMVSWARDAMDLGWYSPIAADSLMSPTPDGNIEISTQYDGKLENKRLSDEPIISFHDSNQLGEAFPIDWINLVKLISPAITRSPPGYSIFICEPLNHWQHPFQSTAGMTDLDEFCMRPTSIGMFLTPDGDFQMNAGTATTVNIPIHRESLISNGYIVDTAPSNK